MEFVDAFESVICRKKVGRATEEMSIMYSVKLRIKDKGGKRTESRGEE